MNQGINTTKGICKISVEKVIDDEDLNPVSVFGVDRFQSLLLGRADDADNHQVSERVHRTQPGYSPPNPVSLLQERRHDVRADVSGNTGDLVGDRQSPPLGESDGEMSHQNKLRRH